MALHIVILAAGKGSRMGSDKPKVMHEVAGKSMINRILDTAESLSPKNISVVCGYGKDELQNHLVGRNVHWAVQAQQYGTGHAVMQALPDIDDNDDVLILVGDAPLIKQATLQNLVNAKQQNNLAILTAHVSNPFGMGRIIRDQDGDICSIIEETDAGQSDKEIKEINTGVMLASASRLKNWVKLLKTQNSQSEYYLTDIVKIASRQGEKIAFSHPNDNFEFMGANTPEQLSELERFL